MIGIIATVLIIISIIPQIIKVYNTKSSKDLSMIQLIVLAIGLFCWIIYGIEINNIVIVLANSISLLLQAFLIRMKILYN